MDHGPGDSVSRFKLRGSRLLDAEPGVTGAGCWIWIELGRGVGAMFGGGCASDRGWVMDRWRHGCVISMTPCLPKRQHIFRVARTWIGLYLSASTKPLGGRPHETVPRPAYYGHQYILHRRGVCLNDAPSRNLHSLFRPSSCYSKSFLIPWIGPKLIADYFCNRLCSGHHIVPVQI